MKKIGFYVRSSVLHIIPVKFNTREREEMIGFVEKFESYSSRNIKFFRLKPCRTFAFVTVSSVECFVNFQKVIGKRCRQTFRGVTPSVFLYFTTSIQKIYPQIYHQSI